MRLFQPRTGKIFEKFAVKTYKLEKGDNLTRGQILREIEILRLLNFCENVVSLECVYETPTFMHLVLKFDMYNSLRELIAKEQNILESEIRYIMEQLLLTVDLLHRQGIVHRDIKPDIIMILDREDL